MRRWIALLLVLLLMTAYLVVPVAADIGRASPQDGADGSSGPGVSAGTQKEFGMPKETLEETWAPTEAAHAETVAPQMPAEKVESGKKETVMPQAPDEPAQTESQKSVSQPVVPSSPKDEGLVQELRDAV